MFSNSISKISVLILVSVVAFVTASFVAHPDAVPSADRSYDSLEQARTTRTMAQPFRADYAQIEFVRISRNSPNANANYDALEQVRNTRTLSADRSFDSLEQLRLTQPAAFAASASGYDMIEVLRLNRGTNDPYAQIEALRLGR